MSSSKRIPLANRSNKPSLHPSPSPSPIVKAIKPSLQRCSSAQKPSANKENAFQGFISCNLLAKTASKETTAALSSSDSIHIPSSSHSPLPEAKLTPSRATASAEAEAPSTTSAEFHVASAEEEAPSTNSVEFHTNDGASSLDDEHASSAIRLLDAEETPTRRTNTVVEDSSFSTPRCTNTENPSSSGGNATLYSRRKVTSGQNLTMSCPPLGRSRLESVTGQQHGISGVWPLKRAYEFSLQEDTRTAQGTRKKAPSGSRRRRSLPEVRAKHWLPEDFVIAQRSHFAEVDAFELSEEEAGSEED